MVVSRVPISVTGAGLVEHIAGAHPLDKQCPQLEGAPRERGGRQLRDALNQQPARAFKRHDLTRPRQTSMDPEDMSRCGALYVQPALES